LFPVVSGPRAELVLIPGRVAGGKCLVGWSEQAALLAFGAESMAPLGWFIRSYLDSAAAHGISALDAVRAAIEGKPWLPPLPAID
jgi:hypothetical protein